MGGVLRVAAIFLATALLTGWPDVANSEIGPNEFKVYEHTDGHGNSATESVFLKGCCLKTGWCDAPKYRHKSYKVLYPDNIISSIWLGEALAMKAFEHGAFEGQSIIFRVPLPYFPPNWNDRISSLIVFCRNRPEPLGAQLYMSSGSKFKLAFIQAPDLVAIYRVQFPTWQYHSWSLVRAKRTSLDVGWRACTGPNFTGNCYEVPDPNNPNDNRLDVWLPASFQSVRSFELWIISEAGKYKCTYYGKWDDGSDIVSCPYAQQQKAATQQGVQAGSLVMKGTSPPPRTAVHPPGGGPATAYQPPVKVPFPADVTSEQNVNRPGLDYRLLQMPAGAPDACRRACLADPRCRAFTYVRPSDRDRRAWCRLKSGVPRPIRSQCCLSGVKTFPSGQASGPAPAPGPSSGVISQCPPGQYFNPQLQRCICLPDYWWNARLRRCVPRATPGRPQVVHRCPPGQYFNPRMRRCVCLPGHWWHARLRRCVARVTPGRTPIVHRCPPGHWWDERIRRCVRRAAPPRPPIVRRCPPGQHWNAGLRRCVCPPGLWWNAGQRRCMPRAAPPRPPVVHRPPPPPVVPRCPPGQQWSPQANRCMGVVR
jgi:hypothetical protein